MTTTNKTNENSNAQPTHTLRKKKGYGKKAEFETIGVAWAREDGGFYIKLYGTQIIDGGFYAFPIKEQSEDNIEGGQQAAFPIQGKEVSCLRLLNLNSTGRGLKS